MRKLLQYKYYAGRTVLSAVVLALALSSCEKFTELEPRAQMPTEQVFSDSANIDLAVNGMYNAAAVGSYADSYTGGRGYPFGAAAIEQDEMRGEDMVNLATFYQITYESTYNTTSANNVAMWVNLYALIAQANVLIEGVQSAAQNGVISAARAQRFEAEAKFLRALSHHELLIHFCLPYLDGNGSKPGVPYRDVAINTPERVEAGKLVGRGTVAEVYTKILADLDYAEANLPASASSARLISRASKGAAIALKTRIKLHMGDWPGVIAEGAKLGTDGAGPVFTSPISSYTLTVSPEEPFTSASSNNESVFSVANSVTANGSVNGALPNMWGPADKGGRGLVATSPNLYNAAFWVTGDSRRELLQVRQTTNNARFIFNYKFRDYVNRTDWAPIIRYAEVLLNVAEAYARQGANAAQAFALLNAVRNRSVPDGSEFTTPPADLVLAILNERRIEFAGEGRRWPDLHRLQKDTNPAWAASGIPAKVLALKGDGSDFDVVNRPVVTPTKAAIAYTDFRFLWPFPAQEVASNPTLAAQQNPGY
jgi:hypothetical protein